MPGIFRRHPFSVKYVSEVPAAVGAHNFGPFHTKRDVRVPDNRTGQFIVEGWPPATAVEFGG